MCLEYMIQNCFDWEKLAVITCLLALDQGEFVATGSAKATSESRRKAFMALYETLPLAVEDYQTTSDYHIIVQ